MKVSLRKANSLQEQLNELIKNRPSNPDDVDLFNYEM